jgi:hypothetical protein
MALEIPLLRILEKVNLLASLAQACRHNEFSPALKLSFSGLASDPCFDRKLLCRHS